MNCYKANIFTSTLAKHNLSEVKSVYLHCTIAMSNVQWNSLYPNLSNNRS